MRKMKYLIGILLLFLVIGFATISTTLSINTNIEMLSDLSDFSVYYSRALVNGEEDPSIITSSKGLDFSGVLDKVGTTYIVVYDVTNASSSFDADITMNCTGSTEYFEISNVFDTSSHLGARQTRTGTLTLKKIKTIADNSQNSKVSCELIATPVERTSLGSGTVMPPLQKPIYIGDIISIDGENFNVISQTEETVTMLAEHSIDNTVNRQAAFTSAHDFESFSNSGGWEYTPGPKEIDVQEWGGAAKTVLNNYVSYLQTITGNSEIKGNLISLAELKMLGCTIQDDYTYTGAESCSDSPYASWLIVDGTWWTRSAVPKCSSCPWVVMGNNLGHSGYEDAETCYFISTAGIRPTITIPVELARKYLSKYKSYKIGEVISIGEEKFNSIEDNGDTVTMFASYYLDNNYRQTRTGDYTTHFANVPGWEYTPGPKEIDIQTWGSLSKNYVNEYVSYLQTELGDTTITGNLISLKELESLGCTIPSDYDSTSKLNTWTCVNSPHSSWLNNKGQGTWTRSADSSNEWRVWYKNDSGRLYSMSASSPSVDYLGVRPIITISKETLKNLN